MRVVSSKNQTQAQDRAASFLADELKQALNKSADVLWLVSGGSSIPVTIKCSSLLELSDSKKITVAQVDERFVKAGSDEENWQNILDKGFEPENFKQAISILACGNNFNSTVENYSRILHEILEHDGVVVALLGIGSDGHTAGIKPTVSPTEFEKFLEQKLVVGYDADDYSRITITATLLSKLSTAVVYAYGEEKRAVINQLAGEIPAHAQPAQLLKAVPSVVVFN